MKIETNTPEVAERNLADLFSHFELDHPALKDWVTIMFELKRLREVERKYNGEEKKNISADPCPKD